MNEAAMKKISNLLALAKSASGTPEGDNAQSKALALAARWNLDINTISIGGVVNDGPQSFIVKPESNSMWRASLAWAISHFAGVQIVRHSGRHAGGSFTVIGRKADYELWQTLFNRAQLEIDSEAKKFVSSLPSWASGKTEGDTFRKGAAEGFRDRLTEYKKESRQSDNGKIASTLLREDTYALVLVGREMQIKNKMAELFPRLKSAHISSKGSSSSSDAGYRFGRGMGVHRGNLA
jgi:hypothetical protein